MVPVPVSPGCHRSRALSPRVGLSTSARLTWPLHALAPQYRSLDTLRAVARPMMFLYANAFGGVATVVAGEGETGRSVLGTPR